MFRFSQSTQQLLLLEAPPFEALVPLQIFETHAVHDERRILVVTR